MGYIHMFITLLKLMVTGVFGKIDEGYTFWDFARFFVSSDWLGYILRKDKNVPVKFPSE